MPITIHATFTGTNGAQSFIDGTDNPWATGGSAPVAIFPSGKSGQSLQFADVGGWASTPNPQALDFKDSPFTVEAWVNPSWLIGNQTYGGYILSNDDPEGTRAFSLRVGNDRSVGYRFYISNNQTFHIDTGPNAVSWDAWSHIAVTRVGDVFRLFVNGNQVGSTIAGGARLQSTTNAVTLGATAGHLAGTFFAGYIDELRVVIGQALYTEAFTPSDSLPPLVFDPPTTTQIGLSIAHSTPVPAWRTQAMPGPVMAMDAEGGPGYATWTVLEEGNPRKPLRRRVWLLRLRDGRKVAEGWSDATTGKITFRDLPLDAAQYVAVALDHTGNFEALAGGPMPANFGG